VFHACPRILCSKLIGTTAVRKQLSDREWDSVTVTAPKVFLYDAQFVMPHGGDEHAIDDRSGAGPAVSSDLVNSRKHR
jgi:hypothetical protein